MISIGKLSERSGVKIPTIRYYEEIGVLPEPERSSGNQRRYDQNHLDRLLFIRHARDLGFSVDAIRELLDLSEHPEKNCNHADKIAAEHLKAVELKIGKLSRLRDELKRMIKECEGGTVAGCHVLEVISDHTYCAEDH